MNNEKQKVKKLEVCDLEHSVGPSGASEAVGGLPCVVLAIGIAVYRAD